MNLPQAHATALRLQTIGSWDESHCTQAFQVLSAFCRVHEQTYNGSNYGLAVANLKRKDKDAIAHHVQPSFSFLGRVVAELATAVKKNPLLTSWIQNPENITAILALWKNCRVEGMVSADQFRIQVQEMKQQLPQDFPYDQVLVSAIGYMVEVELRPEGVPAQAEQLLRQHGIGILDKLALQPNRTIYQLLLQLHTNGKANEATEVEVEKLLNNMQTKGYSPDADTYHALVQYWARQKNKHQQVQSLFEKMKEEQILPHVVTLSRAVKSLVKNRMALEVAQDTVEQLIQHPRTDKEGTKDSILEVLTAYRKLAQKKTKKGKFLKKSKVEQIQAMQSAEQFLLQIEARLGRQTIQEKRCQPLLTVMLKIYDQVPHKKDFYMVFQNRGLGEAATATEAEHAAADFLSEHAKVDAENDIADAENAIVEAGQAILDARSAVAAANCTSVEAAKVIRKILDKAAENTNKAKDRVRGAKFKALIAAHVESAKYNAGVAKDMAENAKEKAETAKRKAQSEAKRRAQSDRDKATATKRELKVDQFGKSVSTFFEVFKLGSK